MAVFVSVTVRGELCVPTVRLPKFKLVDDNAPTPSEIPSHWSAVKYGSLIRNPMPTVQIPRAKVVNRRKAKPYLTPEEFDSFLALVDKPYASMIYVAVHSGLRASKLIGLRWEDVHTDSLTVDERYCRGDWSVTKTPGSSAKVAVDSSVIARIQKLRSIEVELNWGGKGARRRMKLYDPMAPKALCSSRSGRAQRCTIRTSFGVTCVRPQRT